MKEYDVIVRQPIGITVVVNGRMVRTPFSARVNERDLEIIKNKIRPFCRNDETCYEILEVIDFNNLSNIKDVTMETNKKDIVDNNIEQPVEEQNNLSQDILQKLMDDNFEDFEIEELECK